MVSVFSLNACIKRSVLCFMVVCFLLKVVRDGNIRDHLCQTLLTLVRKERNGEVVDRYIVHYILPVCGSVTQKCPELLLISSGLMQLYFVRGFRRAYKWRGLYLRGPITGIEKAL